MHRAPGPVSQAETLESSVTTVSEASAGSCSLDTRNTHHLEEDTREEMETEVDLLRSRVTASYSKVRNLTKKLRRRDAELSRQEEELSTLKEGKKSLEESCRG